VQDSNDLNPIVDGSVENDIIAYRQTAKTTAEIKSFSSHFRHA